jgi:hypothetical protein
MFLSPAIWIGDFLISTTLDLPFNSTAILTSILDLASCAVLMRGGWQLRSGAGNARRWIVSGLVVMSITAVIAYGPLFF